MACFKAFHKKLISFQFTVQDASWFAHIDRSVLRSLLGFDQERSAEEWLIEKRTDFLIGMINIKLREFFLVTYSLMP